MSKPKSILKDAALFTASGYLSSVASFASAIIVRRILSPFLMGIYSQLAVVFEYAKYNHLGMLDSLDRQIPYYNGRREFEKTERIKNTGISFSLVTSLGAALIIIAFSYFLKGRLSAPVSAGLKVIAFMVVVQCVTTFYVTLARTHHLFGHLSRYVILVAVCDVFFKAALGLKFGIIGILWASVFTLIAGILYLFKRTGLHFRVTLKLSLKRIRPLLGIGFPLLLAGFTFMALRTIDRIMIISLLTREDLGYYSIAIMMFSFVFQLPNLMYTVLFPRFYEAFGRSENDMDKIRGYVEKPTVAFALLFPILIGAALITLPVFVRYVLPRYSPGITPASILLLGTVCISMTNMSGYLLVALKKQRALVFIGGASVAMSALLNLIFVKIFHLGITGIALGTAVTYFLYSFFLIGYAARHYIKGPGRKAAFFATLYSPLLWIIFIFYAFGLIFHYGFRNLGADIALAALQLGILLILTLPLFFYANKRIDLYKRIKDAIFKKKLSKFLKRNAPKKKLVIINSHDKIESLRREIKDFSGSFGKDDRILFFKSRIPGPFRTLGEKAVISEDYLTREDYEKIDNYVFRDVSKNWDKEYPEQKSGIFTYRGIELARIAEYDFQVFLLAKIKALAVLERAIKRENYEAFFIIDSNGELLGLDKLLRKHYGFTCDFVTIGAKKPSLGALKGKASSFISGVVDFFFAGFALARDARLIDARLFHELGEFTHGFTLAPFEEGLRLRLRCIRESGGYLAFDVKDFPFPERKMVPFSFPGKENLESRFVFEGINYWLLIEDRIKALIYGDFARFRKNIDIFLSTHKARNIKSVILRNDVKELEKTIVLAAKESGIPTVVIQHGILAEPNGHDTIFADNVAVWGERSMRWYRDFGNDPAKLSLTGNPRFDSIFNYERDVKDEPGPTGKKLVVTLITACQEAIRYSSFETDDMNDILIEEVARAAEALGNIEVAVKLHPSADRRFFKRFIEKKAPGAFLVNDKTNLHELLRASDAVITPDSTVGLEAIIMGKPVIAVNLTKRPSLLPYAKGQAAIGAHTADEIKSAIRKALYDKEARSDMDLSRSAFIKDFVFMAETPAAERIRKLIEQT